MKKQLLCAISAIFLVFFTTSCAEKNVEETTAPRTSVEVIATAESETEHAFDKSNFETDENGFLSYSDGQFYSLKGIDVSSYSGDIDWSKVAQSGVEFAMIRLGGRGYGDSGTLYADEKALYNIDEARKNGLKVGGYFFSQATTEDEATEEAEFTLEIIGGDKLDLPIAYDFEHIEGDDARTDNVTAQDIQKFAAAFGRIMQQNGYKPMIYDEDGKFDTIYKENSAVRWIAEYEETPEIDGNVKIWQYSKEGKVDGITGSVDLDIMFTER